MLEYNTEKLVGPNNNLAFNNFSKEFYILIFQVVHVPLKFRVLGNGNVLDKPALKSFNYYCSINFGSRKSKCKKTWTGFVRTFIIIFGGKNILPLCSLLGSYPQIIFSPKYPDW